MQAFEANNVQENQIEVLRSDHAKELAAVAKAKVRIMAEEWVKQLFVYLRELSAKGYTSVCGNQMCKSMQQIDNHVVKLNNRCIKIQPAVKGILEECGYKVSFECNVRTTVTSYRISWDV